MSQEIRTNAITTAQQFLLCANCYSV